MTNSSRGAYAYTYTDLAWGINKAAPQTGLAPGALAAAIAVPIVALLVLAGAGFVLYRR